MESDAQRRFIELLVDAIPSVLEVQMLEGSKGACLGTSALLAVVLNERGIYTEAVRGRFGGEAHWWLESATLRLDPTRRQFDEGDLVTDRSESSPHEESERWPAVWTEKQALLEFSRMYAAPTIGAAVGEAILDELRELAIFAAK